MNKERLQEIKDSIDLQLTVAKSIGIRNELAEEEKELYDEVVRLNNAINEIEAIVYADVPNIDARISIQEALDKLKEE